MVCFNFKLSKKVLVCIRMINIKRKTFVENPDDPMSARQLLRLPMTKAAVRAMVQKKILFSTYNKYIGYDYFK